MEKIVIPIIGGIALLVILIFVIGAVLANTPQYAMVDASETFLFPSGSRLVIAIPQGGYYLNGILQDGCYKLTPALVGAPYGEAEYSGPTCQ